MKKIEGSKRLAYCQALSIFIITVIPCRAWRQRAWNTPDGLFSENESSIIQREGLALWLGWTFKSEAGF